MHSRNSCSFIASLRSCRCGKKKRPLPQHHVCDKSLKRTHSIGYFYRVDAAMQQPAGSRTRRLPFTPFYRSEYSRSSRPRKSFFRILFRIFSSILRTSAPHQRFLRKTKPIVFSTKTMGAFQCSVPGCRLLILLSCRIRAQGTFADLFQRLLAEDVLCLAGILGGGLFVHAQLHEEVGEQTMAAVDAFCDLTARLQQGQVAFAVHRDIAVFPQLFHGDAHARLGKAQLIDHVNGAHFAHALGQHQDRFKIIFCGLVDLHGLFASCLAPPHGGKFSAGMQSTTVRMLQDITLLPLMQAIHRKFVQTNQLSSAQNSGFANSRPVLFCAKGTKPR